MSNPAPTPPPPQPPAQTVSPSLSALLTAITQHPSWSAQAERRAGELYWMHNFVRAMQRMLDETASAPDPAEARKDVGLRCVFQQVLFNDNTGKLALMTQDPNTEFTQEIKERAKECADASAALTFPEGEAGG